MTIPILNIGKMKKSIYCFIISTFLISCQNFKTYESLAVKVSKQLDSSYCKNDFWNFEVVSRGDKRFIFIDNSRQITTSFSDSVLSIDTVIYDKKDFLPFTGLQTIKIEQMLKIAHCFEKLDIQKIRGFDSDTCKYLECIVNDNLSLYYVPEIDKNKLKIRNLIDTKHYYISENYFFIINK